MLTIGVPFRLVRGDSDESTCTQRERVGNDDD